MPAFPFIGTKFIAASCLLALQGCAATPSSSSSSLLSAESDVSVEKAVALEVKPAKPKHNAIAEGKMSAEQMFRFLQAEMVVSRGDLVTAFGEFYSLAAELKDPDLLKRTFQLSMATYEPDKIQAATELWKQTQPEAEIPWRASYLLKLRAQDVDGAFEDWQTYQELSKADLNEDILTAAQRIAGSVPAEAGLMFFEKMADAYPDDWSAHFGMAIIASAHQMPNLAIEALKQAAKYSEGEALSKVYQSLAKLYVQTSEVEEGIAELRPYLQDNPQDYLVLERYARLLVLQESYQDAEKQYQRVLDANPDSAQARLSLALLQMEQKEYPSALENLEQLISVKGFGSVASYYKGMALQDLKRYDEALQALAQVKGKPYKVDALLHSAEILFTQQKLAETYAILDQIPEGDPEVKVKKLRALAIFKGFEGKLDEALALYEAVLEIEPGNVDVLLAKSYIFYNFEDYARYEAVLNQVLELDPDNVEALNGLGYYYAENKIKLPLAESMLKKAMQVAPDNYYVVDSLGWLYFQMQDYSRAVQYLEQAWSMREDEEVFLHLVKAYIQAGDLTKAQKLWNAHYDKFQNVGIIEDFQKSLPW